MKKYFYEVYGIRISSEFPLNRYIPTSLAFNNADLEIKSGKVRKPASNLKNTLYKPYSITNHKTFYLEIPHIAKYKISGCNEITIDINTNATLKEVLLFLYDTVLPIALIKNDIFLFRSSAIKGKNGAYLFCAQSGGGKSTLATSFILSKRKKFIEDDRAFLNWDEKNNRFFIINQSPYLELWRHTSKQLKAASKLKFTEQVRKGILKSSFNVDSYKAKKKHPVERLYLLTQDNNTTQIEEKPIVGINKIQFISNFTYFNEHMQALGKAKEHFLFISKVAQHTTTKHIRRSRLTKIEDFTKFMYDQITK